MRVLVISLGWEQVPLIEHLSERSGLELYGIHYDNRPHCEDKFREIFTADIRDLQHIIEYADRIQPDAIISDQCDYSLFAQALLANRYSLPGPSLEAAQLSNNKYLQRLKSKSSGIKIPSFNLCWFPEQVHQFAEHNGLPVILKPLDNRGSFGVIKIEHIEDIDAAFDQSLVHSHSRMLLVEDFIDGSHITVDGYAFLDDGNQSLALATKTLNPDNPVALEIVYPGNLPSELFKNALENNVIVNKKLGYSFGMTHSEYMVRGDEIFLIESGNRGGGVFTSEIIAPYSADIDLVRQYVSDCLGEHDSLYTPSKHRNVVLRFFSFKPGRVVSIHGWESMSNDANILRCDLFVKPGDIISSVTSDANRHGYFIYKGRASDANDLLSMVEVMYEE